MANTWTPRARVDTARLSVSRMSVALPQLYADVNGNGINPTPLAPSVTNGRERE